MTAFAETSSLPQGAAPARLAVVDDPLEQGRFTRWVVGAGGERLGESALQLSGMHCAACSGIIEQALLGVGGVRSAQVSAAGQRASGALGPGADAAFGADRRRARRRLRRRARRRGAGTRTAPRRAPPAVWRLFVASFCAMQVMMFATPSYVAGPGELADDMRQLLNWGSWLLSLPVLWFAAGPFFSGAWRGLRQRRIGMDVPVALGIAVTFVASSGATFAPGGLFGHEVYFDSLTMFVSFLLGGRYLELRARHRAAAALESALARLPESAAAHRRRRQQSPPSACSACSPGDRVRVAVGQAFPADGVLLVGRTRRPTRRCSAANRCRSTSAPARPWWPAA